MGVLACVGVSWGGIVRGYMGILGTFSSIFVEPKTALKKKKSIKIFFNLNST